MSSYGYSQSCALESSLSSALQSHETAYDALSNCVYLFGGGTRFNTIVATIYKRDMSQTNWITLSVSTPTRIKDSSSNYRSGKIYKFDILTENWISNTQLTPPAHPSTYGCLSENGTHLFMVGGQSGSSTNDDYLQMYHINDNSWSTEWIDISPIKGNGWVYQYCHIVGNDLYAFGGLVGGIGRIDNIFKYDPLNKWLLLSSTLPSVASSGATVFKYPYIYLVGGWDGGNALNTIVEFGIDTETITNTYTMRESIHSMGADIINDKVYILGGATGVNNAITNVEQCDILHASTHPSNDPSYPPSKDPSSSPKTSPVETSIRPTYDPSRKERNGEVVETYESSIATVNIGTGNRSDHDQDLLGISAGSTAFVICTCVLITCYLKWKKMRVIEDVNDIVMDGVMEIEDHDDVIGGPPGRDNNDDVMMRGDSIESLYINNHDNEQTTTRNDNKDNEVFEEIEGEQPIDMGNDNKVAMGYIHEGLVEGPGDIANAISDTSTTLQTSKGTTND
eukprot:503501_1